MLLSRVRTVPIGRAQTIRWVPSVRTRTMHPWTAIGSVSSTRLWWRFVQEPGPSVNMCNFEVEFRHWGKLTESGRSPSYRCKSARSVSNPVYCVSESFQGCRWPRESSRVEADISSQGGPSVKTLLGQTDRQQQHQQFLRLQIYKSLGVSRKENNI